MRKSRLRKTVAAALAILIAMPLGMWAGGIPVHDAVANLNRAFEHSMTMVKFALQIEELQQYRRQFEAFDQYRRWIDGEFQKARARLQDVWTHGVQSGDLDFVPSGAAPPFSGTAPARELERTVQALRAVMNGSVPRSLEQVGPAVRALVGDSPETIVGARTSAATREITTHIALLNRMNAAVIEKRANIDFLRHRINSGTLTPGDLQRELTLVATEQADLQSLQIQAQNAATRVALQQLSLQTSDVNGRELERIRDSHDRLSVMRGASSSFSFASAASPR